MTQPNPFRDFAPLRTVARLCLFAGCLVTAFGQASCITETESSVRRASGMRTEGVIVQGGVDDVWAKVQDVLESMTNAPLKTRGLDRSITTTVGDSEVRVLVETHGPTTTAVHVTSDNRSLADSIRLRIMR